MSKFVFSMNDGREIEWKDEDINFITNLNRADLQEIAAYLKEWSDISRSKLSPEELIELDNGTLYKKRNWTEIYKPL